MTKAEQPTTDGPRMFAECCLKKGGEPEQHDHRNGLFRPTIVPWAQIACETTVTLRDVYVEVGLGQNKKGRKSTREIRKFKTPKYSIFLRVLG